MGQNHKPPDSPSKFRFFIGKAKTEQPSPYLSVAEDIEWLRDSWLSRDNPPAVPDLRRGSAVLRRLLVDGLVHEAWKFHSLGGAPTIVGPDLLGALNALGHEARHAIFAIAGGGTREGMAVAALHASKAKNLETGISADAEEGFAVVTGALARKDVDTPSVNQYQEVTDKVWRIPAYLDAAGAVQFGSRISRRSIIKYFSNHAGGVHLNKIKATQIKEEYKLLGAIEQISTALDLNGVYFELFSIGQAVGRSTDFANLASAIHSNNRA